MAESNRQRRVFPDAFKLEAVAAVRGGRSVPTVAAELGLPDRLVRSRARRGPGGGPGGLAAGCAGPGGARRLGAAGRRRRAPCNRRRLHSALGYLIPEQAVAR